MANALATALYLRGADVCLITTKQTGQIPARIYTIDVESAEEMFDYTVDAVRVAKKGVMKQASMNSTDTPGFIQRTPFLFMAAAVSDFTPKFPQSGKLKKSMLGESWSLELVQTPDILASLNKEGIRTVAFKAEMDETDGLEHAKALLDTKGVDAVCYNLLKNSESFGTTEHEIEFISADHITPLGRTDKLTLSFTILDEARKLADD
jgi:phosphopantothenoylcysteine decarboxylase/phosphopantothenate--cysteine ligase